jgi:uncharacterized protein YlxW (UPF0749 family)
MTNTLDEDYEVAAARQEPRPGRNLHVSLVAGVISLGLLLGIAAVHAQEARPVVALERAELIDQINDTQRQLDEQQSELSDLRAEVNSLQQNLTDTTRAGAAARDQLRRLGMSAGTIAITGPGLRIVVDDAPDSGGTGRQGVIRDTDLQALVNALWAAGAEGISIDGHRLSSLSAIRFAGSAITADYRSLSPPYVVEAIGDPDSLPARLSETSGGQMWLGLRTNFGIRYDRATRDRITLAANPREHLLYAQPRGTR